MGREHWGSKLGFILAAAGSAIGLANIWRFPYVVGKYGGGAFICAYLLCLIALGFPIFIAEVLIGRTTQKNPCGAFRKIGRTQGWSWAGTFTVITGFVVSSFYSAIAGWILGYLVEAFQGNLTQLNSADQFIAHHATLMSSPAWTLSFHFLFLLLSTTVLYLGVRKGIERGSKIMMPLLFGLLFILVINGLNMGHAKETLSFLFSLDWNHLTPTALIVAMGQAFFTLSLGQGTLVTYGSYLSKQENLIADSIPVVLMDTLVSILSAIAVFSIVFSVGLEADSGPGLIFHTLPLAFSQIQGGYWVAILFFLLVVLAALTSEISALEPLVAFLMDEKGWKRHHAVVVCGIAAFLLGIPSALSSNALSDYTLWGFTFLDSIVFVTSSVMIPLGGLMAIILVGWRWDYSETITHLKQGAAALFAAYPRLTAYFYICFKYTAPALILFVFLNALFG